MFQLLNFICVKSTLLFPVKNKQTKNRQKNTYKYKRANKKKEKSQSGF